MKIVLGFALALLLAGTAGALWAVHRSLVAVRDSYAQWDLALATIQYMKEHTGTWPPNWSSLHEAYTTTPNLRGPGPWEDVTNRADMDFAVNSSIMLTQQFRRVIWLRNGRNHHWTGAEPNELIRDYLAQRTSTSGAANAAPPHR